MIPLPESPSARLPLPALPAPPQGAPWGRPGRIYNFDTASLLGLTLSAESLRVVRQVADATDAQRSQESNGVSHGFRVAAMGAALGIDPGIAGRTGVLVDAISIASDLADNIADAEEDAANGRDFTDLYTDIPYARLVAMPALLVGAVIAAIPVLFPAEVAHPACGTSKLMGFLDTMARGQGRAFDDPRRIEEISAVQGTLYMLPVWIAEGPNSELANALTPWAVAWAANWQLTRDHLEHPEDARVAHALAEARAQALAQWPSLPAFQEGGPFSPAQILPA